MYCQMMEQLGLRESFKIPSNVIAAYASETCAQYRNVPYHSFTHAFSVTQFLFVECLRIRQVSQTLLPSDLLALFAAALVHDAGHPGTNNGWEVANKTNLAARYDGKAVLEQYHAAVGQEIMAKRGRNMFGTLSPELAEEARRNYVHAILMTDMAEHATMVKQLQARSETGKAFQVEDSKDRMEMVGVLLHSADISNPLVPTFNVCRTWAERISQEFINQYQMEVKANLPPTQMWANLNSRAGLYKSQVGFIDFMVAPLWKTLLSMFPNLQRVGGLGEALEANRSSWAQLLREEEEQLEKKSLQNQK